MAGTNGNKRETREAENAESAAAEIQSLASALHRIGIDLVADPDDQEAVTYAGVTIKALSRDIRTLAQVIESELGGFDSPCIDVRRLAVPGYKSEEVAA